VVCEGACELRTELFSRDFAGSCCKRSSGLICLLNCLRGCVGEHIGAGPPAHSTQQLPIDAAAAVAVQRRCGGVSTAASFLPSPGPFAPPANASAATTSTRFAPDCWAIRSKKKPDCTVGQPPHQRLTTTPQPRKQPRHAAVSRQTPDLISFWGVKAYKIRGGSKYTARGPTSSSSE